MFKRSVSPNLRGRVKQHYRCELNNGIYEGDMLHYKKDGVGVFLHDEGSAYIGQFQLDTFHGEGILLFKRGGVFYGQFEKGKAQGFFITSWKGTYICGNLHQGGINGYLYCFYEKTKTWKTSEFFEGKKIKDIKEETTSSHIKLPMILHRDSFLSQKYLNFLDLRIESIFKKNVEGSLSLLESDQNSKQKYIGFIGKSGSLKGLGLILNEDVLQMSGSYEDGKIHGFGRISHANGDIYEGFFRKDEMEGQGIYYTKIHDSFVHAIFKRNECFKVLLNGQGFPLQLCHKMKQRAHQKSVEYMNSNLSLRQAGVNLPLIFKSLEIDLSATSRLNENSPFMERSLGQSKLISQPFTPMSPEKQLLLTQRDEQSYRLSPFRNQQGQQKENIQNSPDINKYEHYLNSSYQKVINSSHVINRSQLSAKRRDIFEASPGSRRSNVISPQRSTTDFRQTPPIEKALSQLASFSPSHSLQMIPIPQKSSSSQSQNPQRLDVTPFQNATNNNNTNKFKPIFRVQNSTPTMVTKNTVTISDISNHYKKQRQESSPILASQEFKAKTKKHDSPIKFPTTAESFYELTHSHLKKSFSPQTKSEFREYSQGQKSPSIMSSISLKKSETPKMNPVIPVVTTLRGQETGQTQLNQKLKKLIGEQKQYSPSFKSSAFQIISDPSAVAAADQNVDQRPTIYHSFKNQIDFNQNPSSFLESQINSSSDRLFPNLSINSQMLTNSQFNQIYEYQNNFKVTK